MTYPPLRCVVFTLLLLLVIALDPAIPVATVRRALIRPFGVDVLRRKCA